MSTITRKIDPIAIVVEDDNFLRVDVADMLDSFGYVVFEVENADAAIRMLDERGGDVSLLFTDVDMPGSRNGFALAREVSAKWPEIAIVISSGHLEPAPGDLPRGACFIGKPFGDETVRDSLRGILLKRQQPDGLLTGC